MATDTQIKFFKGAYGITGPGSALVLSTNNQGAIYFDTTSHTICVGGIAYGGSITDVTFADSLLTITKVGTDPIVLDFTDTASASATFKVFQHLNSLIGTATDDETLAYDNTNYLSAATTLIGADKALDTAIKTVDTRIDNMDATNVRTVTDTTTGDIISLTINGINEADGVISANNSLSTVTFAAVAKTGEADDVSISTKPAFGTATNVQEALEVLAGQITAGDVSIDGEKGAIVTDPSLYLDVSTDGDVTTKTLKVVTDSNGYLTTTQYGIDIDSNKIDIDGTSQDATDLTTVGAVKSIVGSAIEELDVTEYAQAEIANDGSKVSIYGIYEEDGKIHIGTDAVSVVFEGAYDAADNRVALESTVGSAIEDLDTTSDVIPVSATTNGGVIEITMKGVAEEDGIIKDGTSISTVTFAKVASTGKAEDITFTTGDYIGSNLEQAVNDMDKRVESLEALPKYDVQVVQTLPANPDEKNMHIIYLMAETGQDTNDAYGEYIVVRSGSEGSYTYSYEKLGTTKADLEGYVKSIVVNGKTYTVPSDGTEITLTDVITSITDGDGAITTDTKYTDAYIDTEVTVISTKDTTAGTNIAQVTSTAKVKVQEMSTADSSSTNTMGLAEASDVKAYIGSRVQELNVAETSVTGTNVSFKYKETNGVVEIGTLVVDYATVTVDTTAEPSLTVTNGTKLAVGSDIEKVVDYVDAKISTSINALDANVTSDDAAVATVQVVETNGVITDVVVTNVSAGVSYTAGDPANSISTNLSATTATGAVTGSDIATIKSYIDAKANEASQTTVTNANATIPVGTTAETILGTVAGVAITAKASFTWEEYA